MASHLAHFSDEGHVTGWAWDHWLGWVFTFAFSKSLVVKTDLKVQSSKWKDLWPNQKVPQIERMDKSLLSSYIPLTRIS